MSERDTLDRSVLTAAEHARTLLRREDSARRPGFLQAVSPAVAVLGLLTLLVLAAAQRSPAGLAVVAAVATGLAAASRLSPRRLLGRVLPVAGAAALVLAPRAVLLDGPTLVGPVTTTGALAVGIAVTRVAVCVSLAAVLGMTVRFVDLLAALERLRVPGVAIRLLGITHRYLLVTLGELTAAVRARRCRRIERHSLRDSWREAGSLLGGFFLRTIDRGEGVQRAARARGGGSGVGGYATESTVSRVDYAFLAVVALTVAGVTL